MAEKDAARPFNDDQLFYAALWWASALPGGADHVPSILARHNKAPVTFPPLTVQRGREEIDPFSMTLEKIEQLEEWEATGYNPADAPLAPKKIDTFFDHLFAALKNNAAPEYTVTGKHRYLDLRQSCATSSTHPAFPDYPFCDELESAIAAAGIPRHALPRKHPVYIHDDGQLFVATNNAEPGKGSEMVSIAYPGRPPLPYRTLVLKAEDMDHCQTLIWESLYRVVPLTEGQPYKWGFISVSGKRISHDDTARKGQALIIGNNDVDHPELLRTLSDEDILAFCPSLRGSFANTHAEYVPGYKNRFLKQHIEESDDPRIVRSLLMGLPFMIAAGSMQIQCGCNFAVASKGDFIIRESSKSTPRVMPKAYIDSGHVRFILPAAQDKGQAAPRFN